MKLNPAIFGTAVTLFTAGDVSRLGISPIKPDDARKANKAHEAKLSRMQSSVKHQDRSIDGNPFCIVRQWSNHFGGKQKKMIAECLTRPIGSATLAKNRRSLEIVPPAIIRSLS